jgi:uncharacterized membrane protein YkvA (DUF1232 family)
LSSRWNPRWIPRLRDRGRRITDDAAALYLAIRHPETPWYAKALAFLVVAYAVSPIDLIPDFIPFIGYLDDAVIVPAGIALVIRLIPPHVMEECRGRLSPGMLRAVRWIRRFGLGLILITWTAIAVGIAVLMIWLFRRL